MSLDVYLDGAPCEHCKRGGERLYDADITHNLGAMAEAAGIYEACWRPEEIGITHAHQLVEPLTKGLAWLREHKAEAEKLNVSNGWGLYENFVPWVERYLAACRANPTATVRVWR